MTEYNNTNSGVLFKNDRKTNDKQPDYTGNINVDGTDYWISSWLKDGKRGKFLSLAVKPKDESTQTTRADNQQQEDDLNSIPF